MPQTTVSAVAPIAYIILVLGSLITFSTIYRRRKAQQTKDLQPWFPTHQSRDIYLTLLHLESPAPPTMLKAALLERAKEDISRIYALREQKPAANQLLLKGSLAETTFQRILAAEKDLNLEIQDVLAEAMALGGEEWGQSIMAQANEYYQKEVILKTIERSKEYAETERKRWDEEQALRKEWQDRQREIALKELSAEGTIPSAELKKHADDGGNTANGSVSKSSKKKKHKK
jgi:translocation protein SEC66